MIFSFCLLAEVWHFYDSFFPSTEVDDRAISDVMNFYSSFIMLGQYRRKSSKFLKYCTKPAAIDYLFF